MFILVVRCACPQIMELTRLLEGAGHKVKEIITSGTPGFQHALAYRCLPNPSRQLTNIRRLSEDIARAIRSSFWIPAVNISGAKGDAILLALRC